jgi:hypothetical protein
MLRSKNEAHDLTKNGSQMHDPMCFHSRSWLSYFSRQECWVDAAFSMKYLPLRNSLATPRSMMEPERASSERAILKKFAVRQPAGRRKLKIQYIAMMTRQRQVVPCADE